MEKNLKSLFFFHMIVIALSFTSYKAPAENYPYRSDCLWLTVPDHANWIYQTGEKARIDVGFYLYGIPLDVEVNYEIGPDMLPSTQKGKTILKNGSAGKNSTSISTFKCSDMLMPSGCWLMKKMRDVSLSLIKKGTLLTY